MKKFRQFGTVIVLIFLPLALLTGIAAAMYYDEGGAAFYAYAIVFLVMVFGLFGFYQITICVSREKVSFSMGVGIIKRSYPLSSIESCRPVKNQAIHGFGIRFIPDGWLYNVSGLDAVELKFKDRERVVRIGTDKPAEVCASINDKVDLNKIVSA